MKTKRTLFSALLAVIAVSTAYAAYNFSTGDLMSGRFFNPFGPPPFENLSVTIEMPSSDYEDYSYKHPVMFRARVGRLEQDNSAIPENLQYIWESDRQGEIGKGFEFEQKLSKGMHHVTCTVSDGNGNRGSTGRYINIINTAPSVAIKSPSESSKIKTGQPIMLQADVSDNEEKVIPDVAVSWKSNLDGEIGKGKSMLIENFSPGTHKITVTAKDSEGGENSVSINLIVE